MIPLLTYSVVPFDDAEQLTSRTILQNKIKFIVSLEGTVKPHNEGMNALFLNINFYYQNGLLNISMILIDEGVLLVFFYDLDGIYFRICFLSH